MVFSCSLVLMCCASKLFQMYGENTKTIAIDPWYCGIVLQDSEMNFQKYGENPRYYRTNGGMPQWQQLYHNCGATNIL